MADERIDIDVSKALGELAKLNKGLVDVQGQAKKTGGAIDDSFDEGFALGVVDALNNLQKEYAELKRSADTLKGALRTATDPTLIKQYTQSVAQLEAGMKKLERAGDAAGVKLKNANKEAGTGRQVFEGFFGSFTKVTLITAAIAAVQKFSSEAIGLATQVDKANKQFKAFLGSADAAGKAVQGLQSFASQKILPVQDVLDAGKGLLAFGEASDNVVPVLGRIADISRATGKNFGELTTIYGKARAAGVLYAEDINQLVDAGIPIIGQFAKQMGVGTDQVKKLASEGKISFEQLELAFFNLTAQGGVFAGQAEAGITAGDRFDAAWTKALNQVGGALKPAWDFILNSLSSIIGSVTSLGDSKGLEDFARKFFNFFGEVNPLFALLKNKIESIFPSAKGKIEIDYTGRDAYEKAKDDLFERERLEKAAADSRKKRNTVSASDAAKAEKERNQLLLAAMKEGQEKEIATENFKFEELKKQLKKYHIDASEATEQHNINISAIELKYTMERINYDQKLIESRKKEATFHNENSKNRLEEERAIRESEISLNEQSLENLVKILESSGAKKEAIDALKLSSDKEIQGQRLESELKFQEGLLLITSAGDRAAIAQIKNAIAEKRLALEGLAIPDAATGGDKKPKNLFSLLGLEDVFNDDDQKKILDSLQNFADNLKQISDDIFGAQVDRADEKIELAQKEIDAAQKFYDDQKALNEQGFANDLGLADKQLEAAKAKEQKAIDQKKQALKEQQKIDTALQLLNLITASANIYKSYSTIPFVGIPLAIGVIATMFGAFIAAKARAAQATKFKYGGEGSVSGDGIIVGASHDAGGVGIEAEGGEFFGTNGRRFGVVNKRMTAKHFDLLSAINKDDRGKMRQALERLSGPSLMRDSVLDASGASGGSVVVVNGGDRKTHRLLSDIKAKNQKSVTVEGNYAVERDGNYTRRRRIRA